MRGKAAPGLSGAPGAMLPIFHRVWRSWSASMARRRGATLSESPENARESATKSSEHKASCTHSWPASTPANASATAVREGNCSKGRKMNLCSLERISLKAPSFSSRSSQRSSGQCDSLRPDTISTLWAKPSRSVSRIHLSSGPFDAIPSTRVMSTFRSRPSRASIAFMLTSIDRRVLWLQLRDSAFSVAVRLPYSTWPSLMLTPRDCTIAMEDPRLLYPRLSARYLLSTFVWCLGHWSLSWLQDHVSHACGFPIDAVRKSSLSAADVSTGSSWSSCRNVTRPVSIAWYSSRHAMNNAATYSSKELKPPCLVTGAPCAASPSAPMCAALFSCCASTARGCCAAPACPGSCRAT